MPADVPRGLPHHPQHPDSADEPSIRGVERHEHKPILCEWTTSVSVDSTLAVLANTHAGDPWRYATVSAPGVILKSTPSQPIAVGEGFHAADLCAPSVILIC